MSSSPSGPSRWEKLGLAPRLQTPIFDVVGARYRHPIRKSEREFVVVNAPDWVNVVALTTDHRLVLVRQFRYGIDDFSLETPGGVIEADEDPVAAGVRELREETGYVGVRARWLGSVRPNPAFQSNRCHFVLVEEVVAAHPLEWDVDEEIEIVAEPVEDVLTFARDGTIEHSLVLNALMLFEPHWRERQGRGV